MTRDLSEQSNDFPQRFLSFSLQKKHDVLFKFDSLKRILMIIALPPDCSTFHQSSQVELIKLFSMQKF